MKYNLRLHIPAYTPQTDSIYLAGNMNDWKPNDEQYRFERNPNGTFSLTCQYVFDVLECKVTRGSWTKEETGKTGSKMPNRLLKTEQGKEQFIRVAAWGDLQRAAAQHTVAENVTLLYPDLEMPQLGRKRRIWAYLPPDYWTANRHYPVIYMMDGQNLFDAYGSFSGEWAVDKALNKLFSQGDCHSSQMSDCIVIGIENGGEHRLSEYSPWPNPEHGGGEGSLYLDFVVNTLKPLIDKTLRTKTDRAHTGIMGSSMGGLISMYAALNRPDIFGMAGVFSPALWFSTAIYQYAKTQKPTHQVRILLMAGQKESETMVSELLDMYETLLEAGHADENLHYDLHSDGEHAEWFWAREFEHALIWLLGEKHTHHKSGISSDQIQFSILPETKQLVVKIDTKIYKAHIEIRDYCHDRQFKYYLTEPEQKISYADWENCLYSIRLISKNDLIFSRRVHLNQLQNHG